MAQGKSKAPQDILSELGVEDLYNFLGVEFQATDKEVETSLYCNKKKLHVAKNHSKTYLHVFEYRSPVLIGRRL